MSSELELRIAPAPPNGLWEMSRFAVAGGGGQADLNSDADKLRSALHEVFTKIDEESVARPPAL